MIRRAPVSRRAANYLLAEIDRLLAQEAHVDDANLREAYVLAGLLGVLTHYAYEGDPAAARERIAEWYTQQAQQRAEDYRG